MDIVLLKLLAKAIESSKDGVIITDATKKDNPVMYVNKATVRMTGYGKGEFVGKNCRFLQGDDKEQPEALLLHEAISQGEKITTTLKNYKKNGKLFYNELSITPIKDRAGVVTHFIGIQRDVTREFEYEEAQQKIQNEMVGRELKMIQLKEKIKELETEIKKISKK
jgi:PAS domain S-box-containing protein